MRRDGGESVLAHGEKKNGEKREMRKKRKDETRENVGNEAKIEKLDKRAEIE